jgi:hypothetical protein
MTLIGRGSISIGRRSSIAAVDVSLLGAAKDYPERITDCVFYGG